MIKETISWILFAFACWGIFLLFEGLASLVVLIVMGMLSWVN